MQYNIIKCNNNIIYWRQSHVVLGVALEHAQLIYTTLIQRKAPHTHTQQVLTINYISFKHTY